MFALVGVFDSLDDDQVRERAPQLEEYMQCVSDCFLAGLLPEPFRVHSSALSAGSNQASLEDACQQFFSLLITHSDTWLCTSVKRLSLQMMMVYSIPMKKDLKRRTSERHFKLLGYLCKFDGTRSNSSNRDSVPLLQSLLPALLNCLQASCADGAYDQLQGLSTAVYVVDAMKDSLFPEPACMPHGHLLSQVGHIHIHMYKHHSHRLLNLSQSCPIVCFIRRS